MKRIANHVKFRPWWYKNWWWNWFVQGQIGLYHVECVRSIPVCLIMGRSNKIIYDSTLFSRLETLFKKVVSCWLKIIILYNGYNKLNWLKVMMF